ncbi:MAG: TdeIII family type II restriction endonuclease [Holosporales bacterium]|nr:TdeIII family type II restriction endonuclease [Holosporales bacterium]
MTDLKKEQIEKILRDGVRNKFKKYKPKLTAKPFHTRLLGKDRLALFSLIQSLNTNFGTTIFEPVALVLAKDNFKIAKRQVSIGKRITVEAQTVIQNIIDDLVSKKKKSSKHEEIELIKKACRSKNTKEIKPTKVDIMLERENGELFLIDIKTAKPNAGEVKGFKRTLLEWTAVALLQNPNVKINTLIAIPYNPSEEEPYARWTTNDMLDSNDELKVAEDFWDFLGGGNTYQDLLDCFEKIGAELKDEINAFFSKFPT